MTPVTPEGAGGRAPGMRGREAVALVARREITERLREKSFQVSFVVSLVIIALVAVLPGALGFGGPQDYTVGVSDPTARVVATEAARTDEAFDAQIRVERISPARAEAALAAGDVDVVLAANGIRAQEKPDDALVNALQAANGQVRAGEALRTAGLNPAQARQALDPPPLAVSTVEPVDQAAEERGGFAFFAVLMLYGQLIGFGYFVAMGVVEEKSSRVVEILLSTIRPHQLLAGKIIGLGVLGLGQLVVLAILGLGMASAAGALDIDGDVIVAAALALAWFLVGYAFYAAAFACAGALVPRQEELQSVLTPLTLMLLISFFVSFAVLENPDGTLATVVSFIPFAAPMTMPPRIALGEASAAEVVAAFGVTLAAAAALVPLAARIYSGAVLRTGMAIKLRDAWRAARA
ncbi:MAG TPA: ABC transporter permease [Solirubrobacteraceae bacterium]|nr:ABC transporter permease [Solirubrobacteraceae bacterium]